MTGAENGRSTGSSLVEQVRAAITARAPAESREAASRARILEELDRLSSPFDEHTDLTHVTGSAVVAGTRGVVLHIHRRLGVWLQPGGHLDAGETPWDAALRETVEETGLAAHHPDAGPLLVHVDVHTAARAHTHLDLRYLLLAPDDDPAPAPGESEQVRWFAWDEAYKVADVSLRGALDAARPHVGLELGE